MSANHPTRGGPTAGGRRGFAVIAVLVLLVVTATLFGLWAQAIVRDRQQVTGQEQRLQAVRLAEAGLGWARARRAADPDYEGETWSVPAESLGGRWAAAVELRVLLGDQTTPDRYEARAVLPVGAVRHVQVTKRIEIPTLSAGEEP